MESADRVASVETVTESGAAPPAWIFGLLVMPYATVCAGFLSTVLSALLRSEQVPIYRASNVIALLTVPTMISCLFSPVVDFWVRRRSWIVATSAASGLLFFVGLRSGSLMAGWAQAVLLLGVAAVVLSSSAIGGLMAAILPPGLRARGGGFYNAGNLGFGALAGGGLLYLSQRMDRGRFAVVLGLVVALPGLLALFVPEPPVMRGGDSFGDVIGRVGREFKETFLRWEALPVLLMLCAPMGTGAAVSLLPGLAPDYGMSIDQVAWMNGVAGGLLMALGSLLVGFLKLPGDLRRVYAGIGLLNAASLGILCLGHPRPATYYVGSTLYLLTVGSCYALLTALALKLLGVSGKSGGTRYAIALSIGNVPVVTMTAVDGMGARWFGVKGLPGIEAVFGVVSALCFVAWLVYEQRRVLPDGPPARRAVTEPS